MKFLPALIVLTLAHSHEVDHTRAGSRDGLHQVEMEEEAYTARTAFCCRISGNVVDISGSIVSYVTSALASASAIPYFTEDVRIGLAISAGVGGLVAGVLHNMKPIVVRIAQEKQQRAEELHLKHSKV